MTKNTPHIHARPGFLVLFLVALALLFAGMRVPDISRPQRPKPNPRAVVASQYKAGAQSFNKHALDAVAIFTEWTVIEPPTLVSTAVIPSFHLNACPAIHPNSGRSPPAAIS